MPEHSSEHPIGLGGNLRDFGVAEVLQLIGQQRKTGILHVKRTRQAGLRLFFDQGYVVGGSPVLAREDEALAELLVRAGLLERKRLEMLWEECEEKVQSLRSVLLDQDWIESSQLEEMEALLTRETIFELLRCDEGAFSFLAKRIRHRCPRKSMLGAEQILMDGLRMLDEWRTFEADLPDEGIVCQFALPPNELPATLERAFSEDFETQKRAETLLMFVDGKRSIREVIDRSLLGTFEGMRIFVALLREGALATQSFVNQRGVKVQRRILPSARVILAGIAGLFPFALMLLLALFPPRSFYTEPMLRPDRPIVLVPDRYGDLRVELDTLTAKRAFEAAYWAGHRLPVGEDRIILPKALESIAPQALVSSTGQPYYYVQQQGRVVPLAPERSVTLAH